MGCDLQLLFLSEDNVLSCGISSREIVEAVETGFRTKRNGLTKTATVTAPENVRFTAKIAVQSAPAYAVAKWFGFNRSNGSAGLPDYVPLVLLNSAETGLPLSLIAGRWLTEMRTAAISVVAAKRMARPQASSIGFIACGAQARSHLDVFRAMFPIEHIKAFSRTTESADMFCERARRMGLRAERTADARSAITDVDLVVTSVPLGSRAATLLRGEWIRCGTFVAMVDRGWSWAPDSIPAFDRIVTDDLELSGPGGSERLVVPGPFAGDVADLVTGAVSGRNDASERTALAFAGTALADAAVAALIYERAMACGIGTGLPL
ncbi:ornithine cyclodeaminase family protein [Microvirga calopogonii]|uniref:ornithine cyclodeaminase family protein n=1 Tax=Microvirga calopogonii TaxID=2078013 RepID=UPI00247963F3|nr:ornithine cyclodeaminase family protein [Microvirga calopogonii]